MRTTARKDRTPKPLLQFQVHCPLSNVVVGGKVIDPHLIPVIVCENKSLMAFCERHQFRCFIRDSVTISQIMKTEAPIATHAPNGG